MTKQKIKFGDLFDKLSKEEEQEPEKKLKIKETTGPERICVQYEEWLKFYDGVEHSTGALYQRAQEISRLKFSSQRITEFSILVYKYQHAERFYLTGIFLSYLINNSKDEKFLIITEGLDVLISCIGAYNTKNITIKGSVGNVVGAEMRGGKIYVKGDAEDWVGEYMLDGEIHVEGNAGRRVGDGMNGGRIYVEGNAVEDVGYGMKGGEIYVHGNIGLQIGYGMERGNIYHKGKLIVRNGIKVE